LSAQTVQRFSKKYIFPEKSVALSIPETYAPAVETPDITVNGEKVQLEGERLKIGDTLKDVQLDMKAPYFDVVTQTQISKFSGYKLIETVPSLDTPVCTFQTKQLEAATKLFPDTEFLIVSHDTPFALERFCSANGIDNLTVLSDARTREFGIQNGLYLPQFGLLTRSIMIVDENLKVVYIDYAEEVTQELDLENALAVLKSLQN
jgi:thioredoxin-dependent peroxiredoxin